MAARVQETLLTREEIAAAVQAMAARIDADYSEEELVVICTLKGAFVFCADLVRAITRPMSVDFIMAASYGGSTSTSGNVRIIKDIETDIADRHVLLLEDIIDTGTTLQKLVELLQSRNPRSLKICCCLNKQERRRVPLQPDYTCFTIPDRFVVGYGLDYNSQFRQLPDVCILDETSI